MLQSASLFKTSVIVALKNDWLNMTQVARLIGVDRTTAWRWIESGRLRLATKETPGGRTLYSRRDLEAWLKSFNDAK